jgi:hypothetical protein
MLLFIPSIINGDWNRLHALITVLTVLYTCVFTAVIIDLFFGIKRARQLNIVRTSYGYRRTINKLISYFGLMLLLTIADIAASIIFKIPYFTVIGTIGIILVEAKSVFEKLKHKEKNVEEIRKILLKLFENKEEIQSIIKFFNSQNQTNNDDDTRISQ